MIFYCILNAHIPWTAWVHMRVCGTLSLTFKEDEPAVVSFVSSIYVTRKTPPEVTNGHGVVIENPVSAHPPEPTTLKMNIKNCLHVGEKKFCCCFVNPKPNLNEWFLFFWGKFCPFQVIPAESSKYNKFNVQKWLQKKKKKYCFSLVNKFIPLRSQSTVVKPN